MNYDVLKKYATARQKEYLNAVQKYGTCRKAANALGIAHQNITKAIQSLTLRLDKGILDLPKILVIPDCQVKPGIDMTFLHCIGKYIVHKKPDRIICLGDFADMPSLCSYDKGKRSYEGARYKNDVEAVRTGMDILQEPIKAYNANKRYKNKPYKPNGDMILGNHEERIDRATQLDAMLHGTISVEDLGYKEKGWQVHPFLKVAVIEGIAFSHYFCTGLMGKPCTTAQQQLNKMHMSCISGHQQGRQTATGKRADGKRITSIIAGSAYDHEADYLGEQGNNHWRGVFMLHNVIDGEFDEVYVPIDYIKAKYRDTDQPMIYCPEK